MKILDKHTEKKVKYKVIKLSIGKAYVMKLNPENEKKIDALLAEMTVHEKVGQLSQWTTDHPGGGNEQRVREMLRSGELGGFLTEGGWGNNPEKRRKNLDYLNSLQDEAVKGSRMHIPAIFGRDVIHGHNTVFPVPMALAASFNPALVEECYAATASECTNDGVMWAFAPMVDVARDPRWGRCVEGPGEDPWLGYNMAYAMVSGYQGRTPEELKEHGHIAACAKHYIGYGAAEGGRDYQKAELSDYTLRNSYLYNFKGAVDAGVRTIMSSFNEISGQPTTSSHYLLTEILRDELGFNGYVVSDDWSIIQLIRQGVAETEEDCAALAINAGLDMDMDDFAYNRGLESAVEKGRVSMEVLDEAVRRVLRVKFDLGLFDNPYVSEVPVDYDAHMALARKMAGECMVLLKNNGVLPLSKNTEELVINGTFLTEKRSILGAWTCDPEPTFIKSLEDGIREVSPNTKLWGWSIDETRLRAHNIKGSDVVVLALGENCMFEGEASGVASIEIPPEQVIDIQNARKYGKKVVGVFFYGRPMALSNVEYLFDAILWCWTSGSETGTAAADILFGDVNPSGKLSVTLPRVTGQIPIYYNSPKSCRCIDEYYGRENALENYRDEYGTPMYPFGHGLSYTEFEYSKPRVDTETLTLDEIKAGKKFKVSVDVKNVGDRPGKETAMCFVRDVLATATRPIKELRGFDKKYIEPGETVTYTFELGWEELGFYHFDKQYYVEPGKFIIFTGRDCYTKDTVDIKVI